MGDCGCRKLLEIPVIDHTSPKAVLREAVKNSAVLQKSVRLKIPGAILARKIYTNSSPPRIISQTPFTMGKRSRKDSDIEEQKSNGNREVKKLILVDEEAVDPSLALLFSSSVRTPLVHC